MKLANCTMHDQAQFFEQYKRFGFDVEATPRLVEVKSADEAYRLAQKVVQEAKQDGFDGLLIGGRTDVMIYIGILAPVRGLKLYIAETERIRDNNDRFVFNLTGVTAVNVCHPSEEVGSLICACVDTSGF